jgi:hypothetical protein
MSMTQLKELNDKDQKENLPIGSYDAMKPWFDAMDVLYQRFFLLEKEGKLEKK